VRIGFGFGTQGMRAEDRFDAVVDDLERLGFDSLWLSERVTGTAPDPLAGLAYAAGRTRKLKLGTSVLVVPGRNPVVLAKELASIDRLSRGRLLPAFGLGVADRAEQQAFGVAREERAAWFDEAVPLIRRLWTEDDVHHDGPRFKLEGVTVRPRPAQEPPEIWLGGIAPSELRRVGRLGEGWLPSFCSPDDAARARPLVEETAAAHSRMIDPGHFGALVAYARDGVPDRLVQLVARRRPGVDPTDLVPVGLPALRRQLERFVAVGFTKFVVVPAFEPEDWTAELEALAAALLDLQD